MPKTYSYTSAKRNEVHALAVELVNERVPFTVLPHKVRPLEIEGRLTYSGTAGGWTLQVAGDDQADLERICEQVRSR